MVLLRDVERAGQVEIENKNIKMIEIEIVLDYDSSKFTLYSNELKFGLNHNSPN